MSDRSVPRRSVLVASGLSALAALVAARSTAAQPTDLESLNTKLVDDFCAAWSTRDVARITAFMADDCIFRISETAPPIKGREEIVKALQPIVASSTSIRFEMLKTIALGPIVINHRIDHIVSSAGTMAIEVFGVFFVKSGAIQEWSDYGLSR